VARYNTDHKQATRQRIVETAGRRFKQDGIDGSGIATLMADAGLTNGAFYAHFESKDDLVANVIAHELDAQARRYDTFRPGIDGLKDLVSEYLTPDHRDHPGLGCPSAALLDEVGRFPANVRDSYTAGARRILDEIAKRLEPTDPASARHAALGLYALMVGTLQLARAVNDPILSQEILDEGIQNALAFMGEQSRTAAGRRQEAHAQGVHVEEREHHVAAEHVDGRRATAE
jgi:TetR/AcrR family transcriptional repressor of nem operon